MPESGTRHAFGCFECPDPTCHETIIGSYTDLLEHAKDHPLSRVFVDEEGRNEIEQIKDARTEALKRDVREHMIVSKQNPEEEDN